MFQYFCTSLTVYSVMVVTVHTDKNHVNVIVKNEALEGNSL